MQGPGCQVPPWLSMSAGPWILHEKPEEPIPTMTGLKCRPPSPRSLPFSHFQFVHIKVTVTSTPPVRGQGGIQNGQPPVASILECSRCRIMLPYHAAVSRRSLLTNYAYRRLWAVALRYVLIDIAFYQNCSPLLLGYVRLFSKKPRAYKLWYLIP